MLTFDARVWSIPTDLPSCVRARVSVCESAHFSAKKRGESESESESKAALLLLPTFILELHSASALDLRQENHPEEWARVWGELVHCPKRLII